MTNSLCKTSVYKAYQDVINDVISNAREHFIEDGVDEAVLQELKQLWETKLAATKAVEENRETEKIIAVNNKTVPKLEYNGTMAKNIPSMLPSHNQMPMPPPHPQQMMQNKQFIRQIPPNNHIPPEHLAFPEWRRVPIQLTIPSAPGVGDGHRILSINVPEVFLQGHHLKSILTGQVISTTMGLPLMTACTFLQEQVNQAFIKYQQQYFSMNNMNPAVVHNNNPPVVHNNHPPAAHNNPPSHDEHLTSIANQNVPQRDGPADSSDEDDDDKSEDGSDNDMHDDKDDDDDDDLEQHSPVGAEEEPLNSEDDVSDADGTEESFETDNVIVCQYDKVTRSRNRWKFHLKDGIMNLNGEDFIFQKASGDAEW